MQINVEKENGENKVTFIDDEGRCISFTINGGRHGLTCFMSDIREHIKEEIDLKED